MAIDKRILTVVILFILKFIFGFWLLRAGRPYNSLLLTVHKLIALGTMVYIIFIANRVRLQTGLTTQALTSTIVTVVLFMIGIISGGLVSLDKIAPVSISIIHKVTPFLSAIATAITVYLVIIVP